MRLKSVKYQGSYMWLREGWFHRPYWEVHLSPGVTLMEVVYETNVHFDTPEEVMKYLQRRTEELAAVAEKAP